MLGQAHMTSLIENATEGIILTESKGSIVLVNPAAERMFGYASSDIIGEPIEILIPSQFKPHHQKLREGFHKNPSNRVMGQGRELYGRKKDGTNLPVEVSLSHYKKDNEQYVIAFIVDITHRKVIEESMLVQQKELQKVSNELRKLNADLEVKVEERTNILQEALEKLEQSQTELSTALDKEKQLNEIKSRFVSMASHEFRTPLSTVLSSASLLSKYTAEGDEENRNRHIDKIKNSVKHLNGILDDFLSLGKLDEGRTAVKLSDFDLKEFTYETVDDIKGLLKKGQQIIIRYSGKAIIYSDSNLLKNIIINLITNAIKFSNEESEIIIESIVENAHASIKVTDFGIGIGTQDQLHLFSSFFRGSNASNIAGSGLGLHIVKRYTDLLNGSVNISSELNKGTQITLSFPINHI